MVVEAAAAAVVAQAVAGQVAVAVAEQGRASAPVEYMAHSAEPQRIRPAERLHIHQESAAAVGPAASRTQRQRRRRSGQYIPAVVEFPAVVESPAVVEFPAVGEGYPAVQAQESG